MCLTRVQEIAELQSLADEILLQDQDEEEDHTVEEDFEQVVRTWIVCRTIRWDKIKMWGKLEPQRAALPTSETVQTVQVQAVGLKKNFQNNINEAIFGYGSKLLILQIDGFPTKHAHFCGSVGSLILSHSHFFLSYY